MPACRARPYRIIPHTADFGIQVFGDSISHLFCNAGYAMYDLIAKTGRLAAAGDTELVISGMDWPDLMVNWLRELLYLWTDEKKLVSCIEITAISEYRLTAEIKFDYYDKRRHRIHHEIKAVTYHQIQVAQVDSVFFAQIIFDL